ncbi:hypothetical protein [Luteimonas mephitis]|uniref:hypothetical protein n=1 Tax=Luteimonas mephitis TaxID=83615 RepID=UPI0012EB8D45|nr:hypothetical protein [Luteimonas mephitis]
MGSKWQFQADQADEDEGLKNAGIETFRDAPYSGIARECGQNSLDAAAVVDGSASRVLLQFSSREVATSSVPGHDSLRQVMQQCLAAADTRNDDKEREFFRRAQHLLSAPSIEILQIGDTGTMGLRGPAERGYPFHALVKSSGVSNKADNSSGGSFGIGKNAAYAISALRTVFYSTIYNQTQFLAQGKTILVSHSDAQGNPRKATGYWGAEGFKPVNDPSAVPNWLALDQQGTTVTAVGFVGSETWRHQVAESLVRNFFAAIRRETIAFDVDGQIAIDAASLGALFEDERIRAAAESGGHLEDLRFSRDLYRCLQSEDAIEFVERFEHLGTVRLRLLVQDGLPKRIAILRNGMYITDNLQHFGDKLARFALQRDFVAVLEPVDAATSAVIRELENPRHDELSHERIEDRKRQTQVRAAFRKLVTWLRDVIKNETTTPPEDTIVLDEMNQFFASPSTAESMPNSENSDADPERPKLTPVDVRKKTRGPAQGGSDGGGGGTKRNRDDGGRSSGDREGSGKGGRGKRGAGAIRISRLRNQASDANRRVRKFTFTPEEDARVVVEVLATGMSDTVALPVRALDGQLVKGRGPVLSVSKDVRVSHEIELFLEYDGPVELTLVRVEEEAA